MENFDVRRLGTEADLAALRQAWATMLAEAEHVSIFLTWEWIYTCWRYLAQDQPLWLLTAWDTQERELVGVAPLMMVEDGQGLLHTRRLIFVGERSGMRLHQDFVARERDRATVAADFVNFLLDQRGEWDVMDLDGLMEATEVRPYLEGAPGQFMARQPAPSPYISLPASWEAYSEMQLSANRRQQLRRRRRQLEGDFPEQVKFRRVTGERDLSAALAALADFMQERRPRSGPAGDIDGNCLGPFHKAFAVVAQPKGWLRMYALEVAGVTIAVEYNFLYRGVLTNYQQGFAPRWERYSPGMLLHGYAIEQAIDEGAEEFDMLPGPDEYKYSWATQERLDAHVMLSTTLSGHAWLLRTAALDAARAVGGIFTPKHG
jgi:CelD/BcsL family acetyltransferase involved in cellulose biosynthesis